MLTVMTIYFIGLIVCIAGGVWITGKLVFLALSIWWWVYRTVRISPKLREFIKADQKIYEEALKVSEEAAEKIREEIEK